MDFDNLKKQLNWNNIPNRELVIYDLETTGFKPKEHAIIEIGAVRIKESQPGIEEFSVLLESKEDLSQEIVELTGITDEILKDEGLPFYIAFAQFKDFVGSSELNAYNAKFDKGFIDELCATYNIPFKNYSGCTMLLCRKAFKLSGVKLSDVAEHLNYNNEGAHRALNDCKLTLACHMRALIELAKQQ